MRYLYGQVRDLYLDTSLGRHTSKNIRSDSNFELIADSNFELIAITKLSDKLPTNPQRAVTVSAKLMP